MYFIEIQNIWCIIWYKTILNFYLTYSGRNRTMHVLYNPFSPPKFYKLPNRILHTRLYILLYLNPFAHHRGGYGYDSRPKPRYSIRRCTNCCYVRSAALMVWVREINVLVQNRRNSVPLHSKTFKPRLYNQMVNCLQ